MKLKIQGREGRQDRVKEYMHERVADKRGRIEQARRECIDRTRHQRLYIYIIDRRHAG